MLIVNPSNFLAMRLVKCHVSHVLIRFISIAIKVELMQNQPSKLFIAVSVTSKKVLDSAIAGLCLSFALEGFSNAVVARAASQ